MLGDALVVEASELVLGALPPDPGANFC